LEERHAACVVFHNITNATAAWQLWHCPAERRFKVISNTTRHAVLTLRLLGSRLVFTSQSRRLEGGLEHHLDYRTNAAGLYQAHINFLLDEAVENITTNCVSAAPAVTFNFSVSPAQVSPSTLGLWEWAEPRTDDLSLYRILNVPHPRAAVFSDFYAGLRFNYPFLSTEKAVQCMSTRTTCLIGDSQMRHHYQHMHQAVVGYTTNCSKADATCSAAAGTRIFYVKLHYVAEWGAAAASVAALNCSHIVVNVGQWPLGFTSGAPWSYLKYRESVESLFGTLSALPAQVYWTDTNPLPPHWYTRSCPPKDWRFPHVVAYYNDIAALSLRMFPRLKSIRLFDIAFQLWDATYDGGHYNAPVGPASAQYIMTALCS
jgi:hypothetical protein